MTERYKCTHVARDRLPVVADVAMRFLPDSGVIVESRDYDVCAYCAGQIMGAVGRASPHTLDEVADALAEAVSSGITRLGAGFHPEEYADMRAAMLKVLQAMLGPG